MLCPSGEKRTYNDNQPSKFMISHKSFSNINRNKMVEGVVSIDCTMYYIYTCVTCYVRNKQTRKPTIIKPSFKLICQINPFPINYVQCTCKHLTILRKYICFFHHIFYI